MVTDRDRTADVRKYYLGNTIIGTAWTHHARARVRNTTDFGKTQEHLHEAIDYFRKLSHNNSGDNDENGIGHPKAILFGEIEGEVTPDVDDTIELCDYVH